jgi:uncharacterized FAD-dependent dehydrogenase
MKKVQVKVRPEVLFDQEALERDIRKQLRRYTYSSYRIARRSIDARGKSPIYVLSVELDPIKDDAHLSFPKVEDSRTVHIIGTGPAGYFAALRLIQEGYRPVLFDRGKDVKARRRDLRGLQQHGIVHPHSNYCFGEGGAGTYSDGKLYTRSVKRGNVKYVLEILVHHGASSDILVDAHPHIGSNKLPGIVKNIRETILAAGGEVHFDTYVTDILTNREKVVGLILNGEKEVRSTKVILATGHSARDIFSLFHKKGWTLEYKPFAMGVRIEHQQPLIDRIQYGKEGRTDYLPASSYSLACQVRDRGVFSFCMCPGGLVVPASTAPGELVVNGMSLSRRDSPYANAGTVVEVREEDMAKAGFTGEMRGVNLQAFLERKVWQQGDGSQKAPAQRLTDFVNGKISQDLPGTSYIPGIYSARMDEILPDWISERLRNAVREFDKRMKGYYTSEATVIGLESRTSSPVRIPRNDEGVHPDIQGLYPCGEGAGYAGGILSAAMDGDRIGLLVAESFSSRPSTQITQEKS